MKIDGVFIRQRFETTIAKTASYGDALAFLLTCMMEEKIEWKDEKAQAKFFEIIEGCGCSNCVRLTTSAFKSMMERDIEIFKAIRRVTGDDKK